MFFSWYNRFSERGHFRGRLSSVNDISFHEPCVSRWIIFRFSFVNLSDFFSFNFSRCVCLTACTVLVEMSINFKGLALLCSLLFRAFSCHPAPAEYTGALETESDESEIRSRGEFSVDSALHDFCWSPGDLRRALCLLWVTRKWKIYPCRAEGSVELFRWAVESFIYSFCPAFCVQGRAYLLIYDFRKFEWPVGSGQCFELRHLQE